MQVADEFRSEMIGGAIDWIDWFIRRVIAQYKADAPRGGAGSFRDIFERVADFFARSLRPADRTKRAYDVAELLSVLLAKERNATNVFSSVRIQL